MIKIFFRERAALFGIAIFVVIFILTIIGTLFINHDPFDVNLSNRLLSPSLTHLLGTDHLGRDLFSRLILGAKLTIGIAIFATATSLVIGVPIGLFSGYIGGKIDAFFMRIVDGIVAFPDFILAIAIAGILGPSLTNIMIAIILVKWITYARVTRSIILVEKEKEYVQAAVIAHSHPLKIVRRHLFPQVVPEIIVMAAIDTGKIILLISALSYLGVGAAPPIPEWGAMLNEGRAFFQIKPSLMIIPGVAIMLVVLGFNFIGDGLKNSINRSKKEV